MKKLCSILLTLCMVLTLLPFGAMAADFTDVPSDAYFAAPVAWAVEQNITQGTGAGAFSPDATCTRGQVVTFLWRAAGEPEPTSSVNPFTDVAPSDYYYNAVLWAVEQNITQGTGNGLFSPGGECTRAQVVTFLHRANGKPAAESAANPFRDVAADAYYYDAVLWAVEQGITSGTGADTFSPDLTCSRGQIVTFLYRVALRDSEVVYLPVKKTHYEEYDSGNAGLQTVQLYTYDAYGNNIRLVHDNTVIEQAVYNALGDRMQRAYTDGDVQITVDYTYNERGDLVQETTRASGGEGIVTVANYAYAEDGRTLTITRTITGPDFEDHNYETITYDDEGREVGHLYQISLGDGRYDTMQVSYTYDAHGNKIRWDYTSTQHMGDEVLNDTDSESYTYTYDDQGRVLTYAALSGDTVMETTTYTYDAEGRLLKDYTAYYDGEVWETVYTYDAHGNMIKLEASNGTGDRSVLEIVYQPFMADRLPAHWQGEMTPIAY